MKTLKIIVIAAMLLVATSVAIAQQTAKVSYTDSYNWHGFKLFGDEYVHPGIGTNVNGIDVEAISHIGNAHDDIEYWDTSLGYTLPSLAGAGLVIKASYGYLILPGTDAQEFGLTAQLAGTIAPRYTVAQIDLDEGKGGQFHVIGVDVGLGDPNALTAVLAIDVTYNDGVFGIEGWTHATAGLTVNVPMGDKVIFQPGVFYQYTIDDAIGPERNEVWYTVGMQYKF